MIGWRDLTELQYCAPSLQDDTGPNKTPPASTKA